MSTGLCTVLTILTKWQCTPIQAMSILQLPADQPFPEYLSEEQLERQSYVLNIDSALHTIFEDPENIYDFMSLPNDDPYFNGKTPLELIGTGDLTALEQVCWHIDALRVC
ncbi:MAG: MbcA/ParS/Xre antitoxin family protein [Amphritea sp.]